MNKALHQKIANGDTELQRNYKTALERRYEAEKAMKHHEQEYQKAKDAVLTANAMIAKCKRRAAEQGYPNLFD